MKKKKLQYKELRALDSAIEQLQELVDGLRAGVLSLERGEQQLQLKPGAVLDFELFAERDGVKERFELTLEWRRQDLTIGSAPPSGVPARPKSMPVPAGSRGLAHQAEAERLFDEDESDGPLSSDDDETYAADDVELNDPASNDPASNGPHPSAAPASPAAVHRVHPEAVAAYHLPEREEQEALEELEDEAVTVRHSSPPTGQLSTARRSPHSDADWFESLYTRARTPTADGRLRLDPKQFADSLAAAELEPQLQQELCTLARQADEEGRDRLFGDRRISELIASTLSGAA